MLDFDNSLVVVSLFLVLIARESRVKFLVKVTLCKRVKNPDIKKWKLPLLSKTARANIQTSLIRESGTADYNFCQRLKVWFDLNIMTYVLEKGCVQVLHIVMRPMDKSAFHIRHCMINIESLAARTCRWKVLRCPAVPKRLSSS